MSGLQYASKFMELSRFAPAYLAYEAFKMNWFEYGLNYKLKVVMSVRTYSFYKEMNDSAINVERSTWSELTIKERLFLMCKETKGKDMIRQPQQKRPRQDSPPSSHTGGTIRGDMLDLWKV